MGCGELIRAESLLGHQGQIKLLPSATKSDCSAILSAGKGHRGDGKRFVLRADEKLTAFMELESAIRGCGELS
jgi:hypothetical protein